MRNTVAAALLGAAAFSPPAFAETVTFDGLVNNSYSYTEAGMTFATHPNMCCTLGTEVAGALYLGGGGHGNFAWYGLSMNVGGAAFNLNSLRAIVWGYNQAILRAYRGDTLVATMGLGYGGAGGDIIFDSQWQNITSLNWHNAWIGAVSAMDNINFTRVSAVPEPSMPMLMACGLLALFAGFGKQRRQQQAAMAQ